MFRPLSLTQRAIFMSSWGISLCVSLFKCPLLIRPLVIRVPPSDFIFMYYPCKDHLQIKSQSEVMGVRTPTLNLEGGGHN